MDLFSPTETRLDDGAVLIRGFGAGHAADILGALNAIATAAPFRHMPTPGGHAMSVGMTNCGAAGWVTDRKGYRYTANDPVSGTAWPAMPRLFSTLATAAAASAGYPNFQPDACLVNRYIPGARMALHQDRDERNFAAPIVSLSFGLPAIFLWGSKTRPEKPCRIALEHGDALVWGGPSRLKYHGIAPLKPGHHPLTGPVRLNLTFRQAL